MWCLVVGWWFFVVRLNGFFVRLLRLRLWLVVFIRQSLKDLVQRCILVTLFIKGLDWIKFLINLYVSMPINNLILL